MLDFDKLRSFLADEILKFGGEVCLACQYQGHQFHSQGIEIHLKDLQSGILFSVQSSLVVDATGSERRVLAQQDYNKSRAIVATGIEYHVKVNPAIYQRYAKALTFFFGSLLDAPRLCLDFSHVSFST